MIEIEEIFSIKIFFHLLPVILLTHSPRSFNRSPIRRHRQDYQFLLLNPFQLPQGDRFPCQIDIAKDLGSPQPLYLRPGTTEFFHPTDRSGIVTMEKSQQMELFCTNGFSRPPGIEANSLSISCAHGSQFRLNGRLYNFNEFACRKYPYHTVQRQATRCFNNGVLVDIGFQLEDRFVKVMTVCHDMSTEQTYYAKYRLTPASVAAQQGFNRPKFLQSEFFPGKDVNFLFGRNQQRAAIAKAVKSETWARKLVQERGDVFLSRGELPIVLIEILKLHKPGCA